VTSSRGRPEHGTSSDLTPSPPGRHNGEATARRILEAAATIDWKAVLAFVFMRSRSRRSSRTSRREPRLTTSSSSCSSPCTPASFANLSSAAISPRRTRSAGMTECLQQLRREPFDFLSSILETGIRDGTLHVHDRPGTAQAIMSMCDYVLTWYRPGGRLGIPAVAGVCALTTCRMVVVIDRAVDDVGCRPENTSTGGSRSWRRCPRQSCPVTPLSSGATGCRFRGPWGSGTWPLRWSPTGPRSAQSSWAIAPSIQSASGGVPSFSGRTTGGSRAAP